MRVVLMGNDSLSWCASCRSTGQTVAAAQKWSSLCSLPRTEMFRQGWSNIPEWPRCFWYGHS